MTLHELSEQIEQSFSMGEISDLCFRLGFDFDNLAGTTLQDKSQALVKYVDRRGQIGELIIICKQLRPKLLWDYKFQEKQGKSVSTPEELANEGITLWERFWVLGVVVWERFWVPGVVVLGSIVIGLIIIFSFQTPDLSTQESVVITSTYIAALTSTSTLLADQPEPHTSPIIPNTSSPSTVEVTNPLSIAPSVLIGTLTPITKTPTSPPTNLPIATPDCSSSSFDEYIKLGSGDFVLPYVPDGDSSPFFVYDKDISKCVLDFSNNAQLFIPHLNQLEPINGTIEAVVKVQNYPPVGDNPFPHFYFITKYAIGAQAYALGIGSKGEMEGFVLDIDYSPGTIGNKFAISEPGKIIPNCWHHLAFRWNNGELDVFVNGTNVTIPNLGYTPGPLGLNYIPDAKHPVGIGNGKSYGNFDGQISQIYFYDEALSDQDISSHSLGNSFCEIELPTPTNTPISPLLTPPFIATDSPNFSCDNISPPVDTCENNNYFACGQAHYLSGEWNLALEDFESEICTEGGSINNSNLYTWYMRSFYLKFALEETTPSDGDFEKAIFACGKAIQYANNDDQLSEAHFQCGEVHRRYENEPYEERWCQVAYHFSVAKEIGKMFTETNVNNLNTAIIRCEASQEN